MNLICLNCGNTEYWQAEIETSKAVFPTVGNLVIDDLEIDGDNWSEQILRENLLDIVKALLHGHSSELYQNFQTGHYQNRYIACAVCGSYEVTPPYCKWQPPPTFRSIDEEIKHNHETFKKLLKKRGEYENNLPVLWQPKTVLDPPLGTHDI